MTDLFDNAFHVLGATPRTPRAALAELAEHSALTSDPSIVAAAKSTLSNPRTRLGAELAWLLGVSPNKTRDLTAMARDEPTQVYGDLGIPPQAAANLIATALRRLHGSPALDIEIACAELAGHFMAVSASDVRRDLNEDRQLAGFPQIPQAPIEEEISNRRRYYVGEMVDALDSLSTEDLVQVVTVLVSESTGEGQSPASTLIGDLADVFELRTHQYITGESDRIKEIIAATQVAADEGGNLGKLNQLVDRIIARIRRWDLVAQPIQLISRSRGLNHTPSFDLAITTRSLAVHLFNKHDYLTVAKKLSDSLYEVFAEVPDIAERVEEDIQALQKIADERLG